MEELPHGESAPSTSPQHRSSQQKQETDASSSPQHSSSQQKEETAPSTSPQHRSSQQQEETVVDSLGGADLPNPLSPWWQFRTCACRKRSGSGDVQTLGIGRKQ